MLWPHCLVLMPTGTDRNLQSCRMVHWHGLCWRNDREPNNLLHEAIQSGLLEADCANKFAKGASNGFGLTATHPVR